MEPVKIDRTHILVLNYNGRELLAECLPSIVAAAPQSPVPCRVSVVNNGSTDGSDQCLAARWGEVGLIREENAGLASFNSVLKRLDEPVVLLLNNDVKLDAGAVEPLVNTFEDHDDAFFSAPLCWTFDGQTYEGMRTRVRSRFGIIQGMCRVPGFEKVLDRPDLTAAAGPVLAVHRQRFLGLGGYDPIFFPGASKTSTWDSGAGWPDIAAIMCPDRWPSTAGSERSGPKSGPKSAIGWPAEIR